MRGMLRFTFKQTVLINVVFVLLILIGVYAVGVIPVERYPTINMRQVNITAVFPGASPSDVESMVTREIEEALEDVEDVDYIRSTSNRQRSRVVVKFTDNADYDKGYDDVRLKVLSIQGELPDTVDPPTFEMIDSDDAYPVVSVNLAGDRSNRALVLMAEEMKTALTRISGVKKVNLQGEYQREYHIVLDPDKLITYGTTFEEVVNAVRGSNVVVPAGDLDTPNGEYVLLVDEQYRSRDQVTKTVVRTDGDGGFLTLGQLIDEAAMRYRDPVIKSSVNGKDCVSLQIIKTWDGNALDIRKAVEELAASYEPALSREGVEVVLTQDSTVEIRDAMRTLGLNLLVGIVLVCALIWLFMGFRNAMLTTIGIPFAFLVTMIFMYLSNYSLNEITLFSFVLISGIVVDDAIVVIENIYRHLQEGKALFDAVVDGTAEVFLPVISATLTTVCAFLPMLIMTGYIGEFFALIPKAVTFALLASVIECLFILPIHYIDYGPRDVTKAEDEKELVFMRALRKPVDRLIHFAIRFRYLSLGFVSLIFLGAVMIAGLSFTGKAPLIRVKFFPDDYGRYFVEVEGPVGTSIDDTHKVIKDISARLTDHGKEKTASSAGFAGFVIDENYLMTVNPFLGHVNVTLPPTGERKFEDYPTNDPLAHLDWVREQLKDFEEKGFKIRVRPQQDGPPAGKAVNVRAVGKSPEAVNALADRMKHFLTQDPQIADELIDLADDRGSGSNVVRFQVSAQKAAELGISPGEVVQLTAAALNGRYVGEFRDTDELVDLKLKLADFTSPQEVLEVPLVNRPVSPILLGDLNETVYSDEAGFLNRFQGERSVNISANLRTGSRLSSPAVVLLVRDFYESIREEYPGATIDFTGEHEDTQRSYTSLAYAFVISILLIYLILATQFQSYLQPLIVLSAIVFSFIGVIFGVFFSRALFTVNNMVALVGVVGVVVNDSLVLIEFINKLYRSGKSRREAVFEGTQIRLRPILLTTLTTVLAFLPMSLGIPEYSLVWGSMASTFVTGLGAATFLTLFMIPVQWDLITEWQEKRAEKRAKAA